MKIEYKNEEFDKILDQAFASGYELEHYTLSADEGGTKEAYAKLVNHEVSFAVVYNLIRKCGLIIKITERGPLNIALNNGMFWEWDNVLNFIKLYKND